MNKYTVIGLYADNQQPWMEHVNAKNPTDASKKAIEQLSSSDDSPDIDNIFIIEVIYGHHSGCLGNSKPIAAKDL